MEEIGVEKGLLMIFPFSSSYLYNSKGISKFEGGVCGANDIGLRSKVFPNLLAPW
jgi:hypothetical protein